MVLFFGVIKNDSIANINEILISSKLFAKFFSLPYEGRAGRVGKEWGVKTIEDGRNCEP